MKRKKELIFGIILVICIVAVIIGMMVSRNNKESNFQNVESTTESQTETKSKTDSVQSMEAAIVKCCYELKYIFAIDGFNKPKDISVSKLTQYALCHLYYGSVLDVPERESLELREASKKDIKNVLKKQFDLTGIKLENSDLYNKKKKIFEMWIPNYSEQAYYDFSAKENNGNIVINAVYYKDEVKSEKKGEATITVAKQGDKYYIKSMK